MHYPGDVDAGPAPGGQERPAGRPGLPWSEAKDGDRPAGAQDPGERYPASGYADGGYARASYEGASYDSGYDTAGYGSAGTTGGQDTGSYDTGSYGTAGGTGGQDTGGYGSAGYGSAGVPPGGYHGGYDDPPSPEDGPGPGGAAARALYGAAGGTVGKGPVRGFPPAPGQSAPVYPPGQFSAWNQAAGRTPAGRAAGGAVKDAWPVAASAEHGYAEPDYAVLAISDPAADATSTQTWAVIDDRTAGSWRDLTALDASPGGGAARSPASRRARAHPARQPAPAQPAAAPPPVPDAASGRGSTRPARANAAGTGSGQAPQGRATGQAAERAVGPAGSPPGRSARGSSRGKRGRKPPKRGRVLLAAGLAVIVAAGSGTYFYLTSGQSKSGPAAAAPKTTPAAGPSAQPSPTSSSRWGHIQTRRSDPQPLTVAELFPAQFTSAGSAYARTAAKAGKHCASAVLGSRLQSAVRAAGCSQVMRASYLSGSRKLMGTIGVLNLKTARTASRAGRATGPSEFIAQLRGAKGPTRRLNKGTGIEEAEVKGHYLILIWAEFANLHAPKGAAKKAEIEQFCTRLLANTANVSLSRRLVTGKP